MSIADAERARAVGVPAFELFAFLHLPEFHGAVFAGGGQEFGIAAPTESGDIRFVAREREQFLARCPGPKC